MCVCVFGMSTWGKVPVGKYFEKSSESSSQRLLLDNKMFFQALIKKLCSSSFSYSTTFYQKKFSKEERNREGGKICSDSINQTTTGQSKAKAQRGKTQNTALNQKSKFSFMWLH